MILRAVLEKAEQFEDFLIQTRRYLHKNPELSGQEYGTTRFLHQKLTEAGIHSEILNTEAGPAVIASIVSDEKNPTIAFRADIDALPVFDKTEVPYSSNICGICHACGHDFNTTVILGLAYVMATVKDQLNVNLKFIFQPSEEASGGALALVKAGVLKDISAIFSLHACPDYEVG